MDSRRLFLLKTLKYFCICLTFLNILKYGTELLTLSLMQLFVSSIRYLPDTRINVCESVFLSQIEEGLDEEPSQLLRV